VRDKAFAVANLQEGRIAADIGCGTGFITEGLVQRGLSVIAVDGSQKHAFRDETKFAGLDLMTTDWARPVSAIQDEKVDYAFANMYLHHVEVPSEAIREMARS